MNKNIQSIIDKYKNQKFNSFEEFYKEVIFLPKVNDVDLVCYTTTKETKPKKFNDELIAWARIPESYFYEKNKDKNLDKKILSPSNNNQITIIKPELKQEGLYRGLLGCSGGKFYIDFPVCEVIEINREEYESIIKLKEDEMIEFRDMLLKISTFNRILYRDKETYKLLVLNTKQLVLGVTFVDEILTEFYNSDFINRIAIKFNQNYTSKCRKDKINIYFSKTIKEDKNKLQKLINLIKNVAKKYQEKGFIFSKNTFLLPYEFDEDKIVANTYTAESFNKSILSLIMIYNQIDDIDSIKNIFNYFSLYQDIFLLPEQQEMLMKFCIQNKNLPFDEFVINLFEYILEINENIDRENRIKTNECYAKNLLKTYKLLFKK